MGGQRQATRVLVKVTEALVPAAFAPHKSAPPPSSVGDPRLTMKDVCCGGGLALWDIAHVRRASDWKAPPLAQVTSGANASSAYDDNAEFLAARPPARVVCPEGKLFIRLPVAIGSCTVIIIFIFKGSSIYMEVCLSRILTRFLGVDFAVLFSKLFNYFLFLLAVLLHR